jgi:hypothetical protein
MLSLKARVEVRTKGGSFPMYEGPGFHVFPPLTKYFVSPSVDGISYSFESIYVFVKTLKYFF